MPIDPHRKLLFLHIPKAGGTTVEEYLGFPQTVDCLFGRPYRRTHGGTKLYKENLTHYPLRRLLSEKRIKKKILLRYFVFTFVRNPYDV